MAKHRGNKHAFQGVIGKQPNLDSLLTSKEEEGFGLKRGTRYDFNHKVTADAFPVSGGSERLSADFKSGRFMSSSANLFKFIGKPTTGRKHSGMFQFFLHLEQVKQLEFTVAN